MTTEIVSWYIKKNPEVIKYIWIFILIKMKFDDVLEEIGGFGRYQQWVLCLTCSANLFAGFFMLNPVFLLGVPLHRWVLYIKVNHTGEHL